MTRRFGTSCLLNTVQGALLLSELHSPCAWASLVSGLQHLSLGTEEAGLSFDVAESRLVRRITQKNSEEDRFRWLTENDMLEMKMSQQRIDAIKAHCSWSGEVRRDRYEPNVLQYRVLLESLGSSIREQEDSLTMECSMMDHAAGALVDEFRTWEPAPRAALEGSSSSSGILPVGGCPLLPDGGAKDKEEEARPKHGMCVAAGQRNRYGPLLALGHSWLRKLL